MGQYKCDLCAKELSTKKILFRHIQSIHQKTLQRYCDVCSRHFARKDSLDRHNRTIHNDRKSVITTDDQKTQTYGENVNETPMSSIHHDTSILNTTNIPKESVILNNDDIVYTVKYPHRNSRRVEVTAEGFQKVKGVLFGNITGIPNLSSN